MNLCPNFNSLTNNRNWYMVYGGFFENIKKKKNYLIFKPNYFIDF
jgi:hypothetical protein